MGRGVPPAASTVRPAAMTDCASTCPPKTRPCSCFWLRPTNTVAERPRSLSGSPSAPSTVKRASPRVCRSSTSSRSAMAPCGSVPSDAGGDRGEMESSCVTLRTLSTTTRTRWRRSAMRAGPAAAGSRPPGLVPGRRDAHHGLDEHGPAGPWAAERTTPARRRRRSAARGEPHAVPQRGVTRADERGCGSSHHRTEPPAGTVNRQSGRWPRRAPTSASREARQLEPPVLDDGVAPTQQRREGQLLDQGDTGVRGSSSPAAAARRRRPRPSHPTRNPPQKTLLAVPMLIARSS